MKEKENSIKDTFQLIWNNTFIWATLFFCLNWILRGWMLTKNPLSGDEPFSLYHAQMTEKEIVSELLKGNNPPLFELLLHYWIQFKDISIGWIRLLPLFFSALTAPFLFLLAQSIKKGSFPIFVTLMYSFSTYHLQFAHEIRVYSLFGLLTVMSFWIFIKVWRDNAIFKWWCLFLAVNILLIYAHYFGFIVLFIQTFLVIITSKYRKPIWQKYSYYVLAMVILYLPLLVNLFLRLSSSVSSKGWLAPPSSIEALYDMLWRFSNKPVVTVLGILILVATVVKWCFSKTKRLSVEALLLASWFCISFFGMFLVSFQIPMFLDRYLIFCSFSYILLLVYGVWYLFPKEKWRIIVSALITILFGVTFSWYKPVNRNSDKISQVVKKAQKEGYSIVISPPDYLPTFTYYYRLNYFQLTDTHPLYGRMMKKLNNENVFLVYDFTELSHTSNKWLYIDVASNLIVENNHVIENLSQKYRLIKEEFLDEISKAYYFEIKK